MAKKQRTDPTSNRLDDMIASLCGWLQEHCDEAVCPDTPSVHANCAAQPSEVDYERAKSLLALEESLEAASHKDIIHEHHKELASMVSTLGKAIDKTIPGNVNQVLPQLQLEPRLVDEAVCIHLLSVGLFDVAESLCTEACLGECRCMQVVGLARQHYV